MKYNLLLCCFTVHFEIKHQSASRKESFSLLFIYLSTSLSSEISTVYYLYIVNGFETKFYFFYF